MSLQIEFTWLVGLLITFFGAAAGVGKLLLSQHQRHQDERNADLEAAVNALRGTLSSRLDNIEAAGREETARIHALERELLQHKAELPLHYVRREDYIRGQSVIEAKLDGLVLRLENQRLKGSPTNA